LSAARRIGLWAPVGLLMAAIHFVSGQGDPPGPGAGWDKLLHAGVYFALGLLCSRACHGGVGPLRVAAALVALALAAGYGALDELYQSTVPGRDASVGDWIADAVGAAAALPGSTLVLRRPSSTGIPVGEGSS
jgi:VanZ family protein